MNANPVLDQQPEVSIVTPKQNYSKWELLVPLLVVTSLLISCIILSPKKYYWNDEFYSYLFLADKSFMHMWGSFHDKINNTPPLYFFLGWMWDKAFGSSELSLRLFSSVGFGVACFIIWIILRRSYSFVGAATGVLIPFCGSTLVLYQNSEARMYGLYIAISSLAVLVYDRISRDERPGYKLLAINAIVHAAFIQTHLHSLFFSGATLASLIVSDWYLGRYRPKVYLSFVAGWLTFLLYLPSFLIQADAGNPRSYLFIPNIKDLLDALNLGETESGLLPGNVVVVLKSLVLIALIFISAKSFFERINRYKVRLIPGRSERKKVASLLIISYAYLVATVAIWLISLWVKPIFMDRYLMPIICSWSILLAHFVSYFIQYITRIKSAGKLNRGYSFGTVILTISITLLVAYLLAKPIRYAIAVQPEKAPGIEDSKFGYSDLPVVVNVYSGFFLQRLQYSAQRSRYRFVLDWPSAVDSSSGLFSPQEYKHLEALSRRYPDFFKNQVVQSKEFLPTAKRFLVLTYPDYDRECTTEPIYENFQCPRWFSMVILSNPDYKVTTLGETESHWKMHLVEAR